ncbi:MAG: hypothetical protein DRJ42_00025 [Deltaproteobacteria bacterium]|nr:MAG: hypothetical protein DRJ42_00025 [Deltaproteobacteria bacterium]
MKVIALLFVALAATTACSDSDDSDGGTDSAVDSSGEMCDEANDAFTSFVAANRACDTAGDCVIIGDCGPNADFTAIRREAAEEGRRLMSMRCYGTFDGPTYSAGCEGGACVTVPTGMYCGMAAPIDSGMDADAGVDGSLDSGVDGAADVGPDADWVAEGGVDGSFDDV